MDFRFDRLRRFPSLRQLRVAASHRRPSPTWPSVFLLILVSRRRNTTCRTLLNLTSEAKAKPRWLAGSLPPRRLYTSGAYDDSFAKRYPLCQSFHVGTLTTLMSIAPLSASFLSAGFDHCPRTSPGRSLSVFFYTMILAHEWELLAATEMESLLILLGPTSLFNFPLPQIRGQL